MGKINWKELIQKNYDEILEEGNKAYNGVLEGNDMTRYERVVFLDESGNVHHYCNPHNMDLKFDDGRKFIKLITLDSESDFLVEEDYSKEYILTLRKERIEGQIEEVLNSIYNIAINLQWLDSSEYGDMTNEWEYEHMEEMNKVKEEATELIDSFCNENNIILLNDIEWESNSSTDEGFYDFSDIEIQTTLSEEELKEKLEQLRRTIGYCNCINVEAQ
ncbi:hypothetical protein Ccar_16225 [Clostridium carboxidivorans P7]|uniref:hypothetical protein n=1 Tax=Clostridium carboxidivorans TaxID=217159 RepID=UPI0002F0DB89|nr:hypothetical protein [Clostridium carboxidivorans]AKN32325.1 hypothetical protein Ccar_16225 [Clostridium carboxidivorans P7]